jgi:hypothetical protein
LDAVDVMLGKKLTPDTLSTWFAATAQTSQFSRFAREPSNRSPKTPFPTGTMVDVFGLGIRVAIAIYCLSNGSRGFGASLWTQQRTIQDFTVLA